MQTLRFTLVGAMILGSSGCANRWWSRTYIGGEVEIVVEDPATGAVYDLVIPGWPAATSHPLVIEEALPGGASFEQHSEREGSWGRGQAMLYAFDDYLDDVVLCGIAMADVTVDISWDDSGAPGSIFLFFESHQNLVPKEVLPDPPRSGGWGEHVIFEFDEVEGPEQHYVGTVELPMADCDGNLRDSPVATVSWAFDPDTSVVTEVVNRIDFSDLGDGWE